MAEGVQFLALRGNQFDCCVNYSGNIWVVLMGQQHAADRHTNYAEACRYLREHYGAVCLGKLGFENAYALAMNPKQAKVLVVSDPKGWTVSHLAEQTRQRPLSIRGDLPFFKRLVWRQFRDTYALPFRERKEIDPTLMYGAVRDSEVDVSVAYTRDGRLEAYQLVLLDDDRHALPPYDAMLLVSARAARKPGFIEALEPLVRDGGAITLPAMLKANAQVDVEQRPPREAVQGLLEKIAARE
jgi:osmoprotectant transport system permease protein